jgi:hypothetical protein
MGCISDPAQVACVLYEHVLEATSRSDQRNTLLACAPNDSKHSLPIAVRAARPDDDRRPGVSDKLALDRVRRHHADLDRDAEETRSVIEGGEGSDVVVLVRREINQQRDDRSLFTAAVDRRAPVAKVATVPERARSRNRAPAD